MIVWSGRGFLSIIVLFVTLFLCILIFPDEADYGSIITAFVTGIFSWYFGKKWNIKNKRILIDEKTGQRLKVNNNHSLFWIPMQYAGIIFLVIGIIILFQNSVLFGILSSIILSIFIAFPLISQEYEKTNYTKNKKGLETKNVLNEEDEKSLKKEKEQIRKEKEDPSRFMPK